MEDNDNNTIKINYNSPTNNFYKIRLNEYLIQLTVLVFAVPIAVYCICFNLFIQVQAN